MTTFLLMGLGVALGMWLVPWKRMPPAGRIISVAILATILVWAGQFLQTKTLGSVPWYDREPYRSLLLYATMLLGMLTSVYVKAIAERRKRIADVTDGAARKAIGLGLDKYDFLYPLLLSILTFLVVLQPQIAGKSITMVVVALAYQTGFFWESLVIELFQRRARS